MRHKACKLALQPEVIQCLLLLQFLFQLIHRSLPLFNVMNAHSKLLLLLDGVVGLGLN
jgi:hypothetical protein